MCVFWMVGFAVIGTNFFASMGKPKKALFLSLTRQIIFLIPLLLFLPNLWGSDGVWFATPMADVLSVSCTIYLVWRERKKRIADGVRKCNAKGKDSRLVGKCTVECVERRK